MANGVVFEVDAKDEVCRRICACSFSLVLLRCVFRVIGRRKRVAQGSEIRSEGLYGGRCCCSSSLWFFSASFDPIVLIASVGCHVWMCVGVVGSRSVGFCGKQGGEDAVRVCRAGGVDGDSRIS